MGFKQSHYDYSLFTQQSGSDIVVVLLYVNDLLISGSNHKLLCNTRQVIQKKFKMVDLGELKFFLGIEFSRSNKGILMTRRKYALDLMSETGLGGAKPVHTPFELNKKLVSVQYDEHVTGPSPDHDKPLANSTMYQKLVGKLLYLTMTWPVLSFTTQVLSQFMHCPKESHMDATLRAVK